jgi:cell wall-associated NlpC family hydrolase
VAPDGRITSTIIAHLPLGARLHGEECGACLTTEYGCVALSHLRAIADHGEDPAAVAERLMGTPYLAGGRSPAGIDAAGLIQLALGLAGREAPRFLDQLATLGQAVAEGAPLRRGDLVIAGETAGLMIDDLMLIHADQAAGKVTVAPYAAVAKDGAVRRRLD